LYSWTVVLCRVLRVVLRMMLLLLLLLLLLRHGDGRRRYLGLFPVSVSVSLSRVPVGGARV
jgi:hypothetical protein